MNFVGIWCQILLVFILFLVYQTLGVNTMLLEVLKRHKLNPSDAQERRERGRTRERERKRDAGGG